MDDVGCKMGIIEKIITCPITVINTMLYYRTKQSKCQIWFLHSCVADDWGLLGVLDPGGEGAIILRKRRCLPVDWYGFTSQRTLMFNSQFIHTLSSVYCTSTHRTETVLFRGLFICSTMQPNIMAVFVIHTVHNTLITMAVNSFRNTSVFICLAANRSVLWYHTSVWRHIMFRSPSFIWPLLFCLTPCN
jgi:hypothetical protein